MRDNALDRRRLRRAFDRAAPNFDSAATLHREIADRMIERLSIIRLNAMTILDAGSATGYATKLLRKRFARSSIIELDHSEVMLRQRAYRRRTYFPWLGLRRFPVCADFQRLPLAPSSVDLIWSNLALHWAEEMPAVFSEAHRVLRPGGLLMFSTFGPDTLKELDSTFRDDDSRVNDFRANGFRVNRFVDMHDVGDVLVQSGYADPVMDMEYLTLTYADVAALLRDLKAQGSSSTHELTHKGLTARNTYEGVVARYEQFRDADGRLPATFEIVYGHAWKPLPRISPAGRPVINIRAK
jgi:malonyl-CoA O-methyltransferase